jgi:hypothetical protein
MTKDKSKKIMIVVITKEDNVVGSSVSVERIGDDLDKELRSTIFDEIRANASKEGII